MRLFIKKYVGNSEKNEEGNFKEKQKGDILLTIGKKHCKKEEGKLLLRNKKETLKKQEKKTEKKEGNCHFVKSVKIRRFLWSVFSIWTEY